MTDLRPPRAYSAALYAQAVAAFDDADWRHSEPNDRGSFGVTSTTASGRPLGGSLEVRGTTVRFVAFGVAANGREAQLVELFRVVNPALDCGSFELDPLLGPVCRTGADLAALLDEDGDAEDPMAVRLMVLGLAATATAVLEAFVKLLDAVAAGADAADALADAGWTGDGRA